ncbi:E1A [Simian adenovirus 3]|uniref:Early E1A protein n=1 Tax=Simian adenovirus 3 TaxID=38420 RepID=A0A9W3HRJ8_9ADEN|nr:E1A [Simian adenovirus 3]AAT84613.1 E1A [Simian adenovirus 3]
MRNFLLSPGLPATVAAELLEDIVTGALGDEPQVISHFCEDFSLHDLYDIDPGVEGQADEWLESVDGFFPDAMLLEADLPPSHNSNTEPESAAIPQLSSGELDLACYETMPPESDEEDSGISNPTDYMVSKAIAILKEDDDDGDDGFRLDAPAVPGRDCKSCEYHRERTGDPCMLCSLCYLRLNAAFVYSPVSDVEEPDSTTGNEEEKPSPPKLTQRCRPNILRPSAQRVSSRKRAAVNCIEDLLEEPTEPLDLSLKRPRPQ